MTANDDDLEASDHEAMTVLDSVRSLGPGERVRVWYGGRYTEPEFLVFEVIDTSNDTYPLVGLDPEFDVRRTTCTLEYDEQYSDGTPYNLRVFARPDVDGTSVVAVETLDE